MPEFKNCLFIISRLFLALIAVKQKKFTQSSLRGEWIYDSDSAISQVKKMISNQGKILSALARWSLLNGTIAWAAIAGMFLKQFLKIEYIK